jgi:cation diffusion facilitator family transporter
VFLLIGIRYGKREATRGHPFGYGKAQFFYSFLVSVLLFGIAGWESAKHGYDALMHPHAEQLEPVTLLGVGPFAPVYINYAVLVGAILFESYAFVKAYRAMKKEIERRNWSGFREAFRKTSNVTTLTALTEDAIALAGAGIALFGVYLSRATGNPMYDAASAFLIGLLLMGFAVALAWENKRLLLGESLPKEEETRLRGLLAEADGVVDIVDFRTVYFGPKRLVVTADVAFDSTLDADEIDDRISAIEDEMMTTNEHVKKVYIEPETRETTSTSAT